MRVKSDDVYLKMWQNDYLDFEAKLREIVTHWQKYSAYVFADQSVDLSEARVLQAETDDLRRRLRDLRREINQHISDMRRDLIDQYDDTWTRVDRYRVRRLLDKFIHEKYSDLKIRIDKVILAQAQVQSEVRILLERLERDLTNRNDIRSASMTQPMPTPATDPGPPPVEPLLSDDQVHMLLEKWRGMLKTVRTQLAEDDLSDEQAATLKGVQFTLQRVLDDVKYLLDDETGETD